MSALTAALVRRWELWLCITVTGLAALWYGYFVYRHALNIPLADDISDVLQVLSAITQNDGTRSTLHLLFEQHNDHRTVSSRLLYYTLLQLNGSIDFRTLVFIANLALPVLLLLICLPLRNRGLSTLVIVPAALLLFQLRCYGITLWSMAAFAYFYVFMYGFACIYCLHRVRWPGFMLAVLFATLGTFTLASGQITWIVGLASLLHQCLLLRRASLAYIPLWCLAATLMLVTWRVGLETPNTVTGVLAHFLETPAYHVAYYLVLLGNALTENSLVLAALAGATLLLLLMLATLRHYRKDDLRLELGAWLIVLSVMAMTLGRAPYSDLGYALSSRYSFPSVLLVATLWVLLAIRLELRNRKFILLAILLAGIYSISSYAVYSPPLQAYLEKRVRQFNRGAYWQFGKSFEQSNAMVSSAVQLGIYEPPPRPHPLPQIAPPARAEHTRGRPGRSGEQ